MDRLTDELSAAAGSRHTTLDYPFTPPKSPAEPVEVAPGIKWLRLPMPFALDHVNVYMVRLERGWLIVDTGLSSASSREAWEAVFSGAMKGETVVGVYCTHYHVDHVGLAGYLADRWRVPLLMSYEEYFTLRGWPMDLKEVPWQHAELLQKAGYPKELMEKALVMFDFLEHITPLPLSFVRLRGGSPLPLSGGDWQVLAGEGHSPEHAMLYSESRRILISGDQLLPSITTNVSVNLLNPEDEPLSRWLASLDRLFELPEDILVLPGHGLPFRKSRVRIEELRAHHRARFKVITDAAATGRLSAFEIMQAMYPYQLNDFDLHLAMGECLAHLRHLLFKGRLEAKQDQDGVIRYRSVPA